MIKVFCTTFDRRKAWPTIVLRHVSSCKAMVNRSFAHGIDRGKAWLTTLQTQLSDSSCSCSSSHSWGTRRAVVAGRRPQPTQRPNPTYPTTTWALYVDVAVRNQYPRRQTRELPGQGWSRTRQRAASNGSVNLKVYYTKDNDRNCAVATRVGWASKTQGRLTVRLKFSDYDGTQWPEYAVAWSQPHTTQLGGVLPGRHLQPVRLSLRHVRAVHRNGQGHCEHRPSWLQLTPTCQRRASTIGDKEPQRPVPA